MSKIRKQDTAYSDWLVQLKQRIRTHQLKAAISVNTELIRTYWELGKDIVELQAESKWGNGFFNELSIDLKEEFPNLQGFSVTNLKYAKRFYEFYNQKDTIRQQLADELQMILFNIPWGHHIYILTKSRSVDEAVFYMQKTLANNWSRSMLLNMFETQLFETQGKAINNFAHNLPALQSDLAKEMTKDPYVFDFLSLTEDFRERELEDALTENITKFLLEMGNGFAYVGRQVRLEVGEEEFFADLLFYHYKLRCFVVVELKAGKFKAEYVSKLGLYVSAINHQMKHPYDQPTIGLLICKSKDKVVAQYTLESVSQPIGISDYQLSTIIPKEIKSSLPDIKDIENEINKT